MAEFNMHEYVRGKVKADPRLHYLIEHGHVGPDARIHQIADSKDFSREVSLSTHGMPTDEVGAKRAIDNRLAQIVEVLFGVKK